MPNHKPETKLPPADTTNWGAQKKAAIVRGIRAGAITRDEACRRYNLSIEELAAWEDGYDKAGAAGLSATKSSWLRERD